MPTNIISSIAQSFGPELVARIASQLGLDKGQVEKTLRVGVPAVLAALGSIVSKPGGAVAVNSAISQQEPGIAANLTNLLGGGSSMMEAGGSLLKSLLGGQTMSALTTAISRYTGVGESGTKSLIGFLVPVVMSMLGDQQRKSGLGIADLLSSQAGNIASALPRDLASKLTNSGILDGAAANMEQGAPSARQHAPAPSAMGSATSSSWALPILAALVLGGFGLWALSVPTETTTGVPPAPSRVEEADVLEPRSADLDQLETLRGVKLGDVDFGAQVSDAVKGIRTTLGNITDEASARAAMEPLKSSATKFDDLAARAGQLPPEARKMVSNAVAAARPLINQALDKALQIPGVGAMIRPTVDSIRSGLDTLATA